MSDFVNPVNDERLSTSVARYVDESTGAFWLKDIYTFLHLKEQKDKDNVRMKIHQLLRAGILVKVGGDDGHFRLVDAKKKPIDLINADPGVSLDVKYPFDLQRVIRTMPKFLCVVAGASGAGKTALLLNFCLENLSKHEVHLFTNTEMTGARIKKRLMDHPLIGQYNMSNLYAWEREDNFQDCIEPDKVNVIDYIEVSSEHPASVGDSLAAIQSKLNTGMAFVAIQKKQNYTDVKGKVWENELGVGGEWSKRKADLYLTLDHIPENKLVIRKARERTHDHVNPVGMAWGFHLLHGIYFRDITNPDGFPKDTQEEIWIE